MPNLNKQSGFLPATAEEMHDLGWSQPDIINYISVSGGAGISLRPAWAGRGRAKGQGAVCAGNKRIRCGAGNDKASGCTINGDAITVCV